MSNELTLRFTRLSPDRHRFEYLRPDGSGEAIELETHSLIAHDLLHYAVETEAGLQGSFYGLLAKVGGYAELSVNGGAALGGEVATTEIVVGTLTVAFKGKDLDASAVVADITDYLALTDQRPPRWLTPALVGAVAERMRHLNGRWKATPFGHTMELTFPLRA